VAHSHIQGTGNFSNTNAATLVKAYGSNVTSGNLLVCGAGWSDVALDTTVTDTQGNTWTAIAGSRANNTNAAQVFWAVAGSSAANTVTMTTKASGVNTNCTERDMWIDEWSGLDTSSPVDNSTSITGTGTNPSGSVTVNSTPSVIYALCMATAGTLGAGSGYSVQTAQNGNTAEYRDAAGTGSQTVAFTNASSSTWAAGVAVFKETGGGGGPTVKKLAAQGAG
jgi:hypothetical protein